MHRYTLISPLAAVLLACGGGGDGMSSQQPASAGDESAAFTWEDAITSARAADATLIPIEVELEQVEGRTLIEVEGIRGDAVVELYYDPASGALVQEGVEELTPEEQASLPALRQRLASGDPRLEDGLAMARQRYAADELREVELEMHGDRLVLEVEVERDGQTTAWVHDAASGELLGEEDEDEHAAEE
ncbi:MAG: PepSY domain-containing protein [Sandaracinaceae bacterium]